jgi:predicted 3-demethylubiquinone-9 3-methyltransferase (glyoxalase superfamily)
VNNENISKPDQDKQNYIQKIAPFLWFDKQAEEAVKFYVSIFKNSSVEGITRYGREGFEIHHMEEGTVMTVDFKIEGQKFIALNGGPVFKFNEAISFQVYCESQEEIDYYWKKLTEKGDPGAQQCGWLKDQYGVSWQIVPTILIRMLKDKDIAKSHKVMKAMLLMKKIDIQNLLQAYGEP